MALSLEALKRLCVPTPDVEHARFIFVAFATYHVLKQKHRHTCELCYRIGNFRTLFDLALDVAFAAKRKFAFVNPRLAAS